MVKHTNYKAPHYAVFPSLLGSNILLSTVFSNTLNLRSLFNVRQTKFHIHAKGQVKLDIKERM